ncbi:MAG TPA: Ig-like domain-containing protein [Spirochaetota bacterium]|nr:Ig-like domain-containing protein [Spirochaetota bacterium]
MKYLINIIFIIISLFLISSCGNEAEVVPPSQSNVGYVDTSPGTELLTLQAIYPENGATNVSRDTDIIIVFSKGVSSATLAGNINLTQGGTPVVFNFSPAPADGDRIIHVHPSTQLGNNLPYIVTVSTGVTSSVDGTNLNAAGTSTFTTIDSDSSVAASQLRILPLTRIPGNTATGISINQAYIEVTFSTAVDPATVTTTGNGMGGSFQLSPPIASGLPSAVAGTGNRTFRLPLNTAAYNTGYTVTLTNAINTGGATPVSLYLLDGYYTWSYTTEIAPTGLPAHQISSVWLTDITDTTATLNWITTTPASNSVINWGTGTNYGSSWNESGDTVTVHSHQIALPTQATKYYFSIDSNPATTQTGYFIAEDVIGTSDDTALSIGGGNKISISSLRNRNSSGVYDGSTYVLWLDGTDVKASFLAANTGVEVWEAVVDSNSRTNPRMFSDGRGYVIVTMESGGTIYAKMIYNNGGAIGFQGGAWGNNAGDTGLTVATGGTNINSEAAVIWGGQGNFNVYKGCVDRRRGPETAIAFDTATYTDIFYDFDTDFTAATAIADADIIFETSGNGKSAVSDYATVTGVFRHAVNQDSANVIAGDTYIIGDSSDTVTSAVADHAVWQTGTSTVVDNSALDTDYQNPTSTTPGLNIYTPHNFTPGIISAGDIFWDNGSLYRQVAINPVQNNFASGNSIYYDSLQVDGLNTNQLIDSDETFILDGIVNLGFIAQNISLTRYAKVTGINISGVLDLDADIFTVINQTYRIHSGLYCLDHLSTTPFDPFYNIQLNSNINSDITNFTVFNSIKTGTADTLNYASRPLLDNDGTPGFDFNTITAVNDVVYNVSTGSFALVNSIPYYNALYLNSQIITLATGVPYYILRLPAVVISGVDYVIGKVDAAGGGNPFTSTGANFDVNGIEKGDLAYNIQDETYAVVTAVTASQLTLNKNIFANNEGYVIFKVEDSFATPRSERFTEAGTVTTDGAGNDFQDSFADFTSVYLGDFVHNNNTGNDSLVTGKAGTTLTLASDIMNPGDPYAVLQPRTLFVFQNSGRIYGEMFRLRDGSEFGTTTITIDNSGSASNPQTISDGSGNAYVFYERGSIIYGAFIDGDGTVVNTGSFGAGTNYLIEVLSDGSGNSYVLYETGTNIYLTKRSPVLANLWTVTIAGADAVIALDSSNQPMIAYATLANNIFINKYQIDSTVVYVSKAVQNLVTGSYVANSNVRKSNISIVSDGSTGAVVSWIDSRYYNPHGYTVLALGVDAAGDPTASWDSDSGAGTDYTGLLIGFTYIYNLSDVSLVSSSYNDGGLLNPLFIWRDQRNSITNSDIYYDLNIDID